MSRQAKYERKLRTAAAKGSLKRLKKVLSAQEEDTDVKSNHHRRRKRDSVRPAAVDSDADRDDDVTGSDDEEAPRELKRKYGRTDTSHRRTKDLNGEQRKDVPPRIDLDARDLDGWTAMHHAAFCGAVEVVQYLIQRGSRLHIKDTKGRDPAHIAAQQRHTDVLSTLQEAGADFGRADNRGETVLGVIQEKLAGLRSHMGASRDRRHDVSDDENMPADDVSRGGTREGWGQRLWEAMYEDVDEGPGNDWYGDADVHADVAADVDADEDEWRDSIARAMRDKAAEVLEGARRCREAAEEKMERERGRERGRQEQESARILAEEERKDREWRERVVQGKVLQQQMRYLQRWADFEGSCNLGLGFKDIPFPVERGKEGELAKVVLQGVPMTEHRKAVRKEILKWHPDKFSQKWNVRLDAKHRSEILLRVNEISQAVQDMYASLPK